MIEVEALSKRFGVTRALDEVSLIVGAGQYASLNLYRKATA
jgi:ABC-type branched-subunit amino acid transport system ATPase component